MRHRSRDMLRESAGFTLVEMLVAAALSMIVIGGAVMVFTAGLHSQPRITTKSDAIQQGRVTMERLVRELRQGSGIVPGTTPSAFSLSFVTYVDNACDGGSASSAMECSVTYTCGSPAGTCTRQVAQPDGSSPGPAVRVVSGLSNTDVFSYSPDAIAPTYVGVKLAFPSSDGANAITLSDGAAFRNAGESG